jgi:serine protease Do
VRVVASGGPGGATSQGSGVVIERGTVVTNCHVIARGISVTVRVGADTYAASTLVSDEELDLCSLSVPGLTAPAVNIGSIGSLRIGQRVYAVGTPYGLDLTISEGIVSSLREVPAGKVIQTTAPISPGSSGGGLFNLSGELVGIMTFQHRYGQNLNFAHPAEWIGQMRTRTASSRNAAPSALARGPSPVAPTAPRPAASPSVLIVGAWRCLTIATGRISEFYYGNDGTVIFAATNGRGESGRYSVVDDKTVVLAIPGQYLSLNIVSFTQEKMVLKKSGNYSEWLSCDRK